MKKLLLLPFLFFVLGSNSLFAQIEFGTEGPLIVFEENSYDFGEIKQGDVVSHVFEFKNNGTAPLILSDVKTTCGCTAPEWTKEPVLPGKKGSVKVTFNSSGKTGRTNKTIQVFSNATNSPASVKIVTSIL